MVYAYLFKWMVFAKESVDGVWKWGERVLPRVSSTHTWVLFTSTGAWDEHIRKVLDNGRKKVNRLIVTGILIWVLAGCCCWQ